MVEFALNLIDTLVGVGSSAVFAAAFAARPVHLRKLPTCCTVQVGGVEPNPAVRGDSVSSRLTGARQPARTTHQNLCE
jgi:hypothetical protein